MTMAADLGSTTGTRQFDNKVKRAIPSVVHMIAGAEDAQQSEEAYDAGKFELPNPTGKAGGVCTSALLQVWYQNPHSFGKMTWVELLKEMRSTLKEMGFAQIPQLSSSRMINVESEPMHICPPGSGRRRAVLIGINYTGQEGELTACHDDCNNVAEYLTTVQGFDPSQMLILMDDGKHTLPTKENIVNAFKLLALYSQPGDVVFVSFSGHGGRVEDVSGDEDDGFDETLIPLDFKTAGQIVDDDILEILVKPLKTGVNTTVLIDCCHAGTVFDLPYVFGADDDKMHREKGFNFQDGSSPIDLDYEKEKTKKKKRTPKEEEKKSKKKKKKKEKEEDDEKKKKKKGKDGPPEEPPRDAPISNITEPQKRFNAEPPPPPPTVCCQNCVVL